MELSFDILNSAYQQMSRQSIMELTAVGLGVAYLLLAMRESLWCWPAAFGSTLISAILFFDVRLPMEALLNIYYLVMALYGFYVWNGKRTTKPALIQTESSILNAPPVIQWKIKKHLLIILAVTIVSLINGWLLTQYTNADYPYVDSLTTWFAVVTTYMVAKKVLENWIYWLIIDGVLIWLFYQKELYFFAVLMGVYCILCIVGYSQWRQSMRASAPNNSQQAAIL